MALALAGCGGGGLFDRDAPDEFAVSRQAPLTIPPDYSLTPPSVGTAGSQQSGNEAEVLEAMFGGPAPRSAAETAIIGQAGAAEPGIRSSVGDPDTPTVNKGALTTDIVRAPQGDGQGVQASIPN
jgi:hypothetical protein